MMAKFLLTAFVCFTGVSLGLASHGWSYDSNAADGPSNWGGLCRNGSKQSPIDISSTTAQHDSNLGAFNLLSYNAKPSGVNFTATNDGHTLVVSFDPFVYNVSGGGLTDTFTTAQFHLHWGSVNTQGSEHYLDGAKFPAEIHFVSFNIKYASVTAAKEHADGLAVLGVFLKLGSSDNAQYAKFLGDVSNLVNKSSKVVLPAFELNGLLPTDQAKYFRYNGSLTTPYCNEAVTWTVFKDAVEISQAQLEKLRSLKINETTHLVNNFRPLQDLNSRTVKASFGTDQPATAASTTAASTTAASTTAASTTAAPTAAGFNVNLNCSNAVLLLMLFVALFVR